PGGAREYEEAWAGVGDQLLGGRDAVHAGHSDVHEHNVGMELPGAPYRLLAVGGLAHHVEVRFAVEDEVEAGADEGLVVDDQDADHAGTVMRGMRACTRQPGPGARGPVWTNPPTAPTRSRMPSRPWPPPGPPPAGPAPSSSTKITMKSGA